jgi:hypothetical protein
MIHVVVDDAIRRVDNAKRLRASNASGGQTQTRRVAPTSCDLDDNVRPCSRLNPEASRQVVDRDALAGDRSSLSLRAERGEERGTEEGDEDQTERVA